MVEYDDEGYPYAKPGGGDPAGPVPTMPWDPCYSDRSSSSSSSSEVKKDRMSTDLTNSKIDLENLVGKSILTIGAIMGMGAVVYYFASSCN